MTAAAVEYQRPRLIVYSTRRARDDADRLIGAVVIENRVVDAIRRGHARLGAEGGYVFDYAGGWVAIVKRTRSVLRTRPAWLITEVQRYSPDHNERRL